MTQCIVHLYWYTMFANWSLKQLDCVDWLCANNCSKTRSEVRTIRTLHLYTQIMTAQPPPCATMHSRLPEPLFDVVGTRLNVVCNSKLLCDFAPGSFGRDHQSMSQFSNRNDLCVKDDDLTAHIVQVKPLSCAQFCDGLPFSPPELAAGPSVLVDSTFPGSPAGSLFPIIASSPKRVSSHPPMPRSSSSFCWV